MTSLHNYTCTLRIYIYTHKHRPRIYAYICSNTAYRAIEPLKTTAWEIHSPRQPYVVIVHASFLQVTIVLEVFFFFMEFCVNLTLAVIETEKRLTLVK